ncbi:MAG: septum formation inhibitor Maf [Betaproteobacteria bacterium]|nr:septum formation inhibitor Maf [Betaproteobacteria bacterium]
MHQFERRVYLASRSSRRRELLKQIGVNFEILLLREGPNRAADVDETPAGTESPTDYVTRVALAKVEAGWARLIQRRLTRFPVLSADTSVTVNGAILGKPTDREQAAAFLTSLSGASHHVHTCVAVKFNQHAEHLVSTTEVTFRELTETEIRQYISTGEPYDKAGGYAIQGRAASFISKISGSYSGVVGLPLFETSQVLSKFGFDP